MTYEENKQLALYIFEWLASRNGSELKGPLENMRIVDRNIAIDGLAHILEHKGKPPNWI